jgi:uncharacterized small protein (DUF1192 family)
MWWLILLVALMIPLLSVVLDSQLGRTLAALLERRVGSAGGGELEHRVGVLEGEVDRLGREVRRLEEQNDFLQRLVAERPQASRALPTGNLDE